MGMLANLPRQDKQETRRFEEGDTAKVDGVLELEEEVDVANKDADELHNAAVERGGEARGGGV